MGRRRAAEPKGGGASLHHEKRGGRFAAQKSLRGLGGPVLGGPGNAYVAYLVMQNGNLEYEERRCGVNTKHQSTKGTDPIVVTNGSESSKVLRRLAFRSFRF